MKKLLFSATLLMGLIGSAHADQLPKKLIGKWCASEARGGTYVKTLKNEPCDEPFIITHKDLGPATEAPCNIISVTVEKKTVLCTLLLGVVIQEKNRKAL